MIRCFIGKSGVGKNYWYNKNIDAGLSPIIPYTTRPKRPNEKDGVDYHFVSDKEFEALNSAGNFLETRSYAVLLPGEFHGDNPISAIWRYATPKIEDESKDYCLVCTIPVCHALIENYGPENIEICYVECDLFVRENRVQARGTMLDAEWERRKIQDEKDFSSINLNDLLNHLRHPIDVIHNSSDKPTFSKLVRCEGGFMEKS